MNQCVQPKMKHSLINVCLCCWVKNLSPRDGVYKKSPLKLFLNPIRLLKTDMEREVTKNVHSVMMFSILFAEPMVLLMQIFVNFENVLESMLPTWDLVEFLITSLMTLFVTVLSISLQFADKISLLINLCAL